jgi:hypothetical protein
VVGLFPIPSTVPSRNFGCWCHLGWDPFGRPVIPAKAGIRSFDTRFPTVCGVDSRFRGNDCDLKRPCLANDTSTGFPPLLTPQRTRGIIYTRASISKLDNADDEIC